MTRPANNEKARITTLCLCLCLAPVTPSCDAADDNASTPAPVYSVSAYDPKRDPALDLAETIKRAKAEHRHILVQVGGDWCGWCRTMTKFFHQNEAVASILAKNYIILKVNYSGANENKAFLENYPEFDAFPHLFVLSRDGSLLQSQDTETFEKGGSYDAEALLAFLAKFAPKTGG